MSLYWRPFIACLLVLISLALLSALPLGAIGQSKTVLAIYSDERLLPANIAVDTALRDSLGLETDNPRTYLSEFLDVSRFGSSDYDKLLSDFFHSKYTGQHLDVIVASGPLAFQFLRRHQADLFTGIPVVLCGVGRESFESQTLPPNFVGVPIAVESLPTIELALRLQPDAREIVIVTGTSEFYRSLEDTLRRDLPHLQTSIPIRYLSGLPLDDLLRELSPLSPNSIVYSPGLLRDSAGRTYIPHEVLRRMADASTAPIYGSYSTYVGSGIVGGYMFTMEDLGRPAAGLVRKVLDGEKLSQADTSVAPPSRYMFDWKQLQRWHIPEKNLPPGSIVLYRELSGWQRYKPYIIGSLSLILVQTLLILALLWQRAAKRKVKADLILAHVRLHSAMVSGKAVGWEWDLKSERDSWFGDLKTMFGIPSEARVGRPEDLYRYVHPEDRQRVSEAVAEARRSHQPYRAQFRVVWPDGTLRWVSAEGKFYYSPEGEPERMLGMAVDITDRKQAEQAVRQSEAELREAQRLANVGSWRWDPRTDTVTWSEELYRIAGLDPGLPAVSYKEHSKLYTAESWDCLRRAVEEALRTGTPYELDLEMIRFDGARRWLIAKGEARRDSTGHVVQLRGTVHDVTERKRTEEALRESQERLRLAQEAVHVGVFEWDVQKNENHWSPELERIYGLTPGSFGGTYEAWIERVHPDDRKRFKWDDQRNVQEGGLFDSEYRIVRPSGEILWLYSRVNLSCDSAGRPVRMLGFAIDITERKRAAEALRESEARERAKVKELETLLDAAPITILIATDAECKCITANRTGSQLHNVPLGANFSRSAIPVGLPLPFRIMRDGVEIPTEELPLQRAAATGIPVLGAFSTVVSEDGTEHHMIGNAAPLFDEDGKPRGAVGAFVDITERKRAEEALRESENKLRLLLDSTAEAIYGIDLEGRCTFCNPACLRALGYERDDGLIGKNMHHLIHHTHTDGTLYPVEECRIFRALRTGEGVHVDDEVLWRANRTSFPAEYWSYPQRRGQEIVGAVVAFIDITERKVAEVALASVSRRLIEAQEQERTRIARELHDDIGQRLALLTIELEQLQQNSPDLPAEVRSRVGVLREQVSGVATDVQSLSHELHSSKLEYLGIATALRAFCEEFSDQQSVEVVFAHDEVPRTLPQGISLCLFRVLQEALHNAVKHSGARHFDVELRVTSNQIQLTVRDSGSGFDVAEAMKTHGLGLVSMAERLKLVDGQLSIDSQPQRGATICASIPLGKVARASV